MPDAVQQSTGQEPPTRAPSVAGTPISSPARGDSGGPRGGVSPATRAARRSIRATRASRSPAIDGRLDEVEWCGAEVAGDFRQSKPRSGAAATERTDVRVLFDGTALFVAARLFDSRPDSIVRRLGRRDEGVFSDWFTVQVDSYRDRRTAFAFSVNPRGVKRDAFVYEDTRADYNWDAVWDAAVRVDSLGWVAELRIPLSQLRFSPPAASGTEQVWGVNFERYVARRDEQSNWSGIPRNAGRFVSMFGDLRGLSDLTPSRRLEVQPYSLVRLTQKPGDAADPFYRPNAVAPLAGVDLKYGVTSALTLTATLNPDFGQVEADPAVVNLTAYETFFPEKRAFFTEGSDLFRESAGGAQLFYSRRIGRPPQRTVAVPKGWVDAPTASTVYGAAKLTGRTPGGWSFGVLDAVTGAETAPIVDSLGGRRTAAVEPAANYAAARVARSFRGGQSGLGVMVTATNRQLPASRELDFLRSAAYSGGLDARHRFGGGHYELSGTLLGSAIRGSTNAVARAQRAAGHYFQRPDATHLRFDSTRTSLAGYAGSVSLARIGGAHWTWGAGGHAVSPGLEVGDLGFQRQTDVVQQDSYVGYASYEPGRFLRTWDVNANQWTGWTFGRERTTTGGGMSGSFQLLNYWGGSLGFSQQLRSLSTDALWGGPALVVPPRTDAWASFYGDGRQTISFQFYGNGSLERETGGRSLGVGSSALLRPRSGLDITVGPYVYWSTDATQFLGAMTQGGPERYVFARVDQTTVSLSARVNLTLTPNLSLQSYVAPFIGSAAYSELKEARALRAPRYAERFHTFQGDEVAYDPESHGFLVDLDGAGRRDTYVYDPSFNSKSFNSNTVFRWEYRPGSAVFVVWTRAQSDYADDGSFRLGRDVRRLFGIGARPSPPRTNIVAVKVSHRLSR
jgi:hypothetical protein